jgi:predicted regulator of Ras-like GTPase activity (Roadblock/LC7/MglB family)
MAENWLAPFEAVVQELVGQGGFQAAVLVSADGLPLSYATCAQDWGAGADAADAVSAMLSLVKDVVDMAQTRLGMGAVDEVSVVTEDRKRLACRYFLAGSEAMILAVAASPQHAYRRLTNRAIRTIQRAW